MPTINEKVAEQIKGLSPAVEEAVIEHLVVKEKNRRVEIITQGLGRLEELTKDAKRLAKPDLEAFDEKGNLSSSGYSKERKEQRDKVAGKITKFENAIEKAIGGDIGDLANLVNQKGD